MLSRTAITGLVLAGGQGRRMGGVDKGLVPWQGRPLVAHVLERLVPQVHRCSISANRNIDRYESFGWPVYRDHHANHPGPLAGLWAGLAHSLTPWVLCVPCDAPRVPLDLADRLAQAASTAGASIVMAATLEADGRIQPQPVFCLVRAQLGDDLGAFIADGGSSPKAWAARHRTERVTFDDPAGFFNANTPDDLRPSPA